MTDLRLGSMARVQYKGAFKKIGIDVKYRYHLRESRKKRISDKTNSNTSFHNCNGIRDFHLLPTFDLDADFEEAPSSTCTCTRKARIRGGQLEDVCEFLIHQALSLK